MTKEESPLGRTVGRMMNKMIRVFKRRIAESGCNVTIEQLALLEAITENKGEVVQQDMAELLGKDKSAILRLIDSLEKKGLAVRTNDPQDRRKNVLQLTPLGHEVIEQIIVIVADINQEFRKGISQEEFDIFNSVAKRIRINAEKML
jgi:DNA-binding MarR family transcriptional regulator